MGGLEILFIITIILGLLQDESHKPLLHQLKTQSLNPNFVWLTVTTLKSNYPYHLLMHNNTYFVPIYIM